MLQTTFFLKKKFSAKKSNLLPISTFLGLAQVKSMAEDVPWCETTQDPTKQNCFNVSVRVHYESYADFQLSTAT